MAKLLKLRRGTTSQHSSFTGAEGEVTIDTDKDTAVVHDGSTAAGRPLAREDLNNVASASITGRLASGAIAGAKIANGAITSAHIAADTVVAADIAANAVGTSEIAADAVTGAQIADNAINSEHYVDGSIDHAHLAFDCVDNTNIQDNSINSEHYVDASIDHVHLSNDCIDGDNIQNDVINSEHYAAASIDQEHIANNAVSTNQLASDAVSFDKMQNVNTARILGRDTSGTGNIEALSAAETRALINVENGATADQTAAEIRTAVEAASDSNVFTDADHSKLNGIESGATADQSNAEIRAAVEAASDSNVFTDADHSKLNGIAASANNYSHPSHPGDDFSVDTGALSGATVVSDIDINVTTDGSGHVTDANGSVSTRTLTLANLGYTGATNANNVTNNNQLTNGAGYITSSSAGKVLQVEQHQKTNTSLLSGNQNTMVEVDSSFRRSITPSATNHKVLITFAITGGGNWNGGTPRVRCQVSIGGGGWSDVAPLGQSSGSRTRCHMVIGSLGDCNQCQTMSMTILHSPSTTSSCNYRFLIGGDVSNNNFHWNRSGCDPNNFLGVRAVSTITLMEISN